MRTPVAVGVGAKVQTCKIDRDFLPSLNSSKIDKRTDFTLTLPYNTDAVRKIRERVGYTTLREERERLPTLSHVASSNFLCLQPLFSGVEVKKPSANEYEAEVQCFIWSAANVNKKHHLQCQMLPPPRFEP